MKNWNFRIARKTTDPTMIFPLTNEVVNVDACIISAFRFDVNQFF